MDQAPFADHFSSGSVNYAVFRPTYPIGLVDELARISPGRDLALDCGCGSGQLSVRLAERFDQVVATDASAAQIEQAKRHDRVTYRTAVAEESGLPDASTDLITVAQAAHWLDLGKFYAEVQRVSRPNAVLALITYGMLHVEGPTDPIIQQFYYETIGPFWPAERRHVEDGYRSLPFPFDEVPFPTFAITVDWRYEDVVGYIKTWSAVKAAEKVLGAGPMERFERLLQEAWGDATMVRSVRWPLSLRVGRVRLGR